MKNNTALLIVDMQSGLVQDGLYHKAEILENVSKLIALCRQVGIEVDFVRHEGGRGSELAFGSEGWEIDSHYEPLPSEDIFDKMYNSAFRGSSLKQSLRQKEITNLIITGLKTDYCMDATVKAAFEHGFRVVVPQGTHSTYDNEYLTAEKSIAYYEAMWQGRYAKVIPFQEVLDYIEKNAK